MALWETFYFPVWFQKRNLFINTFKDPETTTQVDALSKNGSTPLLVASREGHTPICESLLLAVVSNIFSLSLQEDLWPKRPTVLRKSYIEAIIRSPEKGGLISATGGVLIRQKHCAPAFQLRALSPKSSLNRFPRPPGGSKK